MKRIQLDKAIVAAGIVAITALIGSAATVTSVKTWYPLLIKSSLNPPPGVFGPVWAVLFIMMALAFYQVLTAPKSQKRSQAIRIFCWQLAVNAMWSIVFFGLRAILSAMLVIIGLWFLIVTTMVAFGKVKKDTTWLLLPYLLWVSFAAYLNYVVVVLN